MQTYLEKRRPAQKMARFYPMAVMPNLFGEWTLYREWGRMPDSLEALDLLLVSVAASRRVRRDGIHFQGLRYMDPTLAVYVGEAVTIRYDPRDITEIRVFHRDRFLCRAVSPEHADRSISLKDIEQARTARRRALRADIATRTAKVAAFLPQPQPAQQTRGKPPVRAKPKLSLYKEDRRP
jgi:putative transposase